MYQSVEYPENRSGWGMGGMGEWGDGVNNMLSDATDVFQYDVEESIYIGVFFRFSWGEGGGEGSGVPLCSATESI